MSTTLSEFAHSDFLSGAANPIFSAAGRAVYYFCVPGDPIPKARTTQRGKWLDAKARRSMAYQEKVAQCARLVWRVPAFGEDVHVEIKCFFYRKDRRVVDRDNLMKAVQDGIERAGVVRRDQQIIRGSDVLYTACDTPHTKVFLCEALPDRSVLALLGEPADSSLAAHRAFLRLTGKRKNLSMKNLP